MMLFRDFEKKVVNVINESGMAIDVIYYVMKSIMAEIEQKYFEYCRMEDAEAAQRALESEQVNEESSSEAEESVAASINEEGTK